ncbi:unnamed protein product [Clonostachys rhizophaga]|uniref:SUR7 family protein pun1 n=1 Tax=Clonostachys rhizophaga TaxID=160324 RepID=A0A9N9YA44_9HYPO|nr:unnamed protein product [Clonostachys rhizophaga]
MALLHRLIVLIPLILSIVGTILSALSLFAGHKQGFMEDYAIARLNVSRIGYDVIKSSSSNNSSNSDDDGGFLDSLKDKWNDVKQDVTEKINDVVGDVAGDVAESIGISEWYSIHVMNACEGDYSPNSTVSGASLNITNCTTSEAGFHLNMTALMDKELGVGPFDINIADLGWDEKMQEKLDIVNKVLLGLFVLYVLGIGFSGLATILCVAAFLLPENRLVAVGNLLLALLATIVLIIASILITVTVTKGVSEFNNLSEKIGVTIVRGNPFLIISWVAAVVMLVAMVFWATRFHMIRKQDRLGPRYVSRSKI